MHALLKYNISSFFSWELFDLAMKANFPSSASNKTSKISGYCFNIDTSYYSLQFIDNI